MVMVAEHRRWLGSVRARITLLASGVVLLVLVLAGVLLVVTQRDALVEQLDDRLELDAARIARSVDASEPVSAGDDDDDDQVVVVLVDGEPVEVAGADADDAAAFAAADGTVSVDGKQYRVVRDDEGDVEVVVAAPLEDVDDSVGGLVRSLALIVPAATVLLAVAVWVLVGRTLRPVERIRTEVESIGFDELGRRVPEPSGSDEIARLAQTMNAMLERLDGAHQRQQRFVADASHELRTPLTRMRAELEFDERNPAAADPAATGRSVLEEIAMLQRLIDDLLVLARRDSGVEVPRTPVDLDDVVLDEARAAGGVDVSGVSAAQVLGDAVALRRAVRNILENARRHAVGRVAVTVGEVDESAVVVVDDDGPGIPPERRAEVFERFARLDHARTSGEGRSGLGLAIVQAIVTEHGGVVAISDSPLGGARLRVTLPRAS